MSLTATRASGPETYGQKVWRKLKEEPLIPAGAALTCLALIQASRKMNRGDKASMNRWLRVRVVAQGATIAALLGYSYFYGFGKFAKTETKNDDAERKRINAGRERERFETRMKEVEELHDQEMGSVAQGPTKGVVGETTSQPPKTIWERFGWGGGGRKEKD